MANIVEVRNLKLGEGIPKICVPLVGKTNEEILEEAKFLKNVKFDLIEWRVDHYENVENLEKVKEIIVDSLSCDEDAVTLEANLKEDLEADSLDAVELIMAVEEEFDIEIPDEKAAEIKTVQDIVDYIKANA